MNNEKLCVLGDQDVKKVRNLRDDLALRFGRVELEHHPGKTEPLVVYNGRTLSAKEARSTFLA